MPRAQLLWSVRSGMSCLATSESSQLFETQQHADWTGQAAAVEPGRIALCRSVPGIASAKVALINETAEVGGQPWGGLQLPGLYMSERSAAQVIYDPSQVTMDQVCSAVEDAGFEAAPLASQPEATVHKVLTCFTMTHPSQLVWP